MACYSIEHLKDDRYLHMPMQNPSVNCTKGLCHLGSLEMHAAAKHRVPDTVEAVKMLLQLLLILPACTSIAAQIASQCA